MTLATFSASDVTVAEFSKCCDNNVSNGSILPRMFSTTAVQPPPKKKKEQMGKRKATYWDDLLILRKPAATSITCI
ncbi:predicted protein [Plenodomus lingam JN3]|uniref:Predicted protein n=1 Tax=Leptosphaeria maculans (strain JN3 / isolate v23.1.3 / race Av1-4-5-6-7-8) TaxID=985895 RepID=E4ZTU8_LEPMJ|nr:predicted protein [Plenodomus lingam JN3]CBX94658.1 predicted protein [Plenodomus lingam JN3]